MPNKVLVFGTGSAAKDFLSHAPENAEIIGLVDNDAAKHGAKVDGYPVFGADQANWGDADYVVIAARAVDPIREQLITLGVAGDRILAFYPSFSNALHAAANRDTRVLNDLFGIKIPPIGLASMYLDPDADMASSSVTPHDFVRDQAFRLAARQVHARQVPGNVAELGVYQGDQARLINSLFPDRALYLFDTFSGFAPQDLGEESNSGLSTASLGDFSDTSLALVLGKLPFADRVKAFPGYFPDSAAGLDDRFAFVSLDVDLYGPTLAGLEWFYPRLSAGGYIFVHDYNNRRYRGVRRAVDEFVLAQGACCVPLPDFAGSVIVMR